MAAGVGVCGLAIGSPAFAVVATVPTPTWQTNGRVNVIVIHGNRAYLGGQFTSVRPAGAPAGSGEVTRNHVAAFNLTTGKVAQWNPNVNGTVRAIQVVGKTVYLGGSFTRVGGVGRARLASVNNGTGAVKPWKPGANAEVLAFGWSNNVLYVGGGFTTAGGSARAHLAAFSTTTGALTGWTPSTDDQVKALVVTADGSRVVVGGLFSQVNGSSQSHIAAINPGAGGSLASWTTHLNYPVIDLAADTHGVYVAGAGGGGNFAGLSPTGGSMWQGGTNGNVQAIGVVGGIVYRRRPLPDVLRPAARRPHLLDADAARQAPGRGCEQRRPPLVGAGSRQRTRRVRPHRRPQHGQPVLGRRLPAHRQPRPAGVCRVRELTVGAS